MSFDLESAPEGKRKKAKKPAVEEKPAVPINNQFAQAEGILNGMDMMGSRATAALADIIERVNRLAKDYRKFISASESKELDNIEETTRELIATINEIRKTALDLQKAVNVKRGKIT